MVLAAVPVGARILDVGCGDGGLVERLTDGGLDAYGIDPCAPEHPRLIRARLEEWDGIGRFDAACAVLSLHHVRLGLVMAALAQRLAPNGRLFVYEFAWEEYDQRAAVWLNRHDLSGADNSVRAWRHEHADLHTGATLRDALARTFESS